MNMKIIFYQVFEQKEDITRVKIYESYKFNGPIKFLETISEHLFVVSPNEQKRRECARRFLIISTEQLKQLLEAQSRNLKEVIVTSKYSNKELNDIIRYWNPTATRFHKALQRSWKFRRINNHMFSNLCGKFAGKFFLPTPPEETLNIPRIVQSCIESRK